MNKSGHQLTGLLVGAGTMYLLDPDRGARRRALLRDRFVRASHKLNDGLNTAARDARNRSFGLVAVARGRLSRSDATDSVIEQRVRTELGRAVSHPGAIEVQVEDGRVTLSGPVLANELNRLLECIGDVRGVRSVENRLDVHQSAGDVSGLQGTGRWKQPRIELMQENWTPSLRLLMGVLGGAVALRGMRTSGVMGAVASAVGLGVLTRAATNLSTNRLVGVNAGRRAVDFQKAINIDAPVEDVWALWSRMENFPRFMTHVKDVRITGDGRSHWVATGPAGSTFEWDAEITQWTPNEVIAWKSVEGATVGNAGMVRFQPTESGGTHVEVRMSYNPPAGALGHALAALFGNDPKRAMDEDLVRLKSLLESGKTSAGRGKVTRDELVASPGAPSR